MIRPLSNNIIFQFINDRTSNGGLFKEITESGFEIVSNTDDSAKLPRWGQIKYVGNDVSEVVENDYILIAPLRWTDYFKHKNEKFWKTNETEILLVSKDQPTSLY